ncbi:hypothetical protein LINPERHAP2_LOCUS9223 [Linum perenne]
MDKSWINMPRKTPEYYEAMSAHDEDGTSSSDEESGPTHVDGVIDNGNRAPQVPPKTKGYWTLPIIVHTQIHVDDSEIGAVRRYVKLVVAERWMKHKLELYKMYLIDRQVPDEEKRRRPPGGVSLQDWVKLLEIMDTGNIFIAIHKGKDAKYKSDEAKAVRQEQQLRNSS